MCTITSTISSAPVEIRRHSIITVVSAGRVRRVVVHTFLQRVSSVCFTTLKLTASSIKGSYETGRSTAASLLTRRDSFLFKPEYPEVSSWTIILFYRQSSWKVDCVRNNPDKCCRRRFLKVISAPWSRGLYSPRLPNVRESLSDHLHAAVSFEGRTVGILWMSVALIVDGDVPELNKYRIILFEKYETETDLVQS